MVFHFQNVKTKYCCPMNQFGILCFKNGKEKRIVENDDPNVLMDCRPIRSALSHLMVCVVHQSDGPSE